MISGLLLHAAQNRKPENLVSGHPLTKGLVHRYVAGARCEEAVRVARQMNSEPRFARRRDLTGIAR